MNGTDSGLSETSVKPTPSDAVGVTGRYRAPSGRVLRLVAWGGAVLVLVALVVVLVRVTGVVESKFFYVPSTRAFQTPSDLKDLSIVTSDGALLHAWFLPPMGRKAGDPPAPAVLFCHGNAGNLPDHLRFCDFLARRGVGVLTFDYRSFGRSSPGRLVRANLMLDTEAAYAYLRTRPDVDPGRIGVYGFSLGGSFALGLAAREPAIRAVCAAAAFSSWPGIASERVPILGRVLIPTGIDCVDSAGKLKDRPLLVVHGDADESVGPHHAGVIEAAAASAGVRVQRVMIPGGDHIRILTERQEAAGAIGDFFVRELGLNAGRVGLD